MNYKGIKFDDITIDGYGVWGCICSNCLAKHHIAKELLGGGGQSLCSIEGCHNDADFYVDFPLEEMKVYVWTHDNAMGIDAVVIAQTQNDEHFLTWHEGDRVLDTMEELPYAKEVFQTWDEMSDYMDTIARIHAWQVQDVKQTK